MRTEWGVVSFSFHLPNRQPLCCCTPTQLPLLRQPTPPGLAAFSFISIGHFDPFIIFYCCRKLRQQYVDLGYGVPLASGVERFRSDF